MNGSVLGIRQTRAYSDIVDIYEPVLGTDLQSMTTYSYSATPSYSRVKCRIQPKPENTQPMIMGKTGNDQIDTTDIIHVPVTQDIGTGYAVQLLTPGHPEYGTWFYVMGEPRTQNWRAGKRSCYLKRGLRPNGVT